MGKRLAETDQGSPDWLSRTRMLLAGNDIIDSTLRKALAREATQLLNSNDRESLHRFAVYLEELVVLPRGLPRGIDLTRVARQTLSTLPLQPKSSDPSLPTLTEERK
jgi:hypothetical protein